MDQKAQPQQGFSPLGEMSVSLAKQEQSEKGQRGATLSDICKIRVKFSEIDAMLCVWHGNYVKYFEDGRESFNRHYPGIDYQTMLENGTPAPIYDIQVKCLAPLGLNDVAVIHTRYVPKRGARLDFEYEIYRERDNALCCKGSTTQLFIDKDGNQLLDPPDFYTAWLQQHQPTTDTLQSL